MGREGMKKSEKEVGEYEVVMWGEGIYMEIVEE